MQLLPSAFGVELLLGRCCWLAFDLCLDADSGRQDVMAELADYRLQYHIIIRRDGDIYDATAQISMVSV